MRDVRARSPQGVEDAQEIDVDVGFEDPLLPTDDRQLLGDASIGHHHIESSKFFHEFGDRAIDLGWIPDVAFAPRSRATFARSFGQQLWFESEQRDQGAFLMKSLSHSSTDATGSSGDQYSFANQRGGSHGLIVPQHPPLWAK